MPTQMQQQLTNFKQPQAPRVLEYSPQFGSEGQTFTVTLQASSDKALRVGFGTLVVDTKQYAANGYVTLSCTIPSFAITKWFASKVPLYVLQMENDMVLESWPFGDFTYYDGMSLNDLCLTYPEMIDPFAILTDPVCIAFRCSDQQQTHEPTDLLTSVGCSSHGYPSTSYVS